MDRRLATSRVKPITSTFDTGVAAGSMFRHDVLSFGAAANPATSTTVIASATFAAFMGNSSAWKPACILSTAAPPRHHLVPVPTLDSRLATLDSLGAHVRAPRTARR